MKGFKSLTEENFFEFMMQSSGCRESTILHYIARLRSVKPLEELVCEDVDRYIEAYRVGGYKMINRKSHGAFSTAFKYLKAFMQTKCLLSA